MRVLVLDITFKENCPDVRNTRAIDVINELKDYGRVVDICDPWADADEVSREFGLELISCEKAFDKDSAYEGAVLCVAHKEFREVGERFKNAPLFDVKNLLPRQGNVSRL